ASYITQTQNGEEEEEEDDEDEGDPDNLYVFPSAATVSGYLFFAGLVI
ncbi:hypothetical protein Tco_0498523, partial [Tanacetum coccineum]